MDNFLSLVVRDYSNQSIDLANHVFVLPNKRAGIFLKKELLKLHSSTVFLPKIIDIEELISDISGFTTIDTLTQVFEFYSIFLKLNPNHKDQSFDSYSKWAFLLLQDFNEIDKNLIEADVVFNYLTDVKRIEKLFLSEKKDSEMIHNYFKFMENIIPYYHSYIKLLKTKKIGYQGLLYREAIDNLTDYIKNLNNQKFVFAGFNALNKGEEKIINEFLNNGIADIYWDSDQFYTNNNHITGKFINTYKSSWKYYNTHPFKWVSNNLNKPKNINIIGTAKNIGQVKYIGDILNKLKDKKNNFQNTAIVLADEKLLPIVLNSLPNDVKNVNITMGYNLKNIALSTLFDHLIKLHLNAKKIDQNHKFFFNDFIKFINLPFLNNFIDSTLLNKTIDSFIKNNTVIIDYNHIKEILNQTIIKDINIDFLFCNWNQSMNKNLDYLLDFISILSNNIEISYLEKEYFFRFYQIFQVLKHLNKNTEFIDNLDTFYHFYLQILQNETLSFKGEPLQGLQIMGMLESRVLDFENIILTSVNEGILPSGKKDNSFIPNDIKNHFGLLTYKEKDAIFSYHFYRLIQRAKNVYLLYNTLNDDFGAGEQSRFITQLEIAKETGTLPNLNLNKKYINPIVLSNIIELQEVTKTDSVLKKLQEIACNGISPSALTSYIRNPIDFYKKRILEIKDLDEVEESVAYNTFGTIIHQSLENLYRPYLNKILTESDINKIKSLVNEEVNSQFLSFFSKESLSSGRNYLSFKIAKKYIDALLKNEISLIKKGKQIRILELEKKITYKYEIDTLKFSITLKGVIDRIDEIDGVLRIVDYKTGKVATRELNIKDWNLLSTDYKYSKSFQVLMYAYLYTQTQSIDLTRAKLKSGIISFKNLKSGFMPINKNFIKQDDMDNFLLQLNLLIQEIFNKDIPFLEKEIKTFKQ